MSSFANILLPHHHHPPSYKYIIFNPRQSSLSNFLHFQRRFFSFSKAKANFNFNFHDDDDVQRRRRRRGRRHKQGQLQWWSDLDNDDDDVESGFLQQLVHNLWILQVFKSYGWFLPVILLSLLIATGPKAFLLGSGIPFGLSIVIFAFQKLWEWLEGSPKAQKRHKNKSKFRRRKGDFIEEDDLEKESQLGKRNKKSDLQSWVARKNGSFHDKDSSSKVGFNSFGGWDELVREDKTRTPEKPSRETERLKRMMEKERLNRSMEERELPLLLKIMIAIFPFLASWTNMM